MFENIIQSFVRSLWPVISCISFTLKYFFLHDLIIRLSITECCGFSPQTNYRWNYEVFMFELHVILNVITRKSIWAYQSYRSSKIAQMHLDTEWIHNSCWWDAERFCIREIWCIETEQILMTIVCSISLEFTF